MAQDYSKKLSLLMPDQIPAYVQDYYPIFVIFMTKYFQYLENTSTGVQATLQNIIYQDDIDTTATNLVTELLTSYVPNFPSITTANPQLVVKYFRQFFQHKGDEKSFKFFFRAFFGDEIDVYYPRDFIFAPSQGNYYIEQSLIVQAVSGSPLNLIHTTVQGDVNGTTAAISDAFEITGQGAANLYKLVFDHNTTITDYVFTTGETLTGYAWNFDTMISSQVTVIATAATQTATGVYLDSRSQLSNNQVLQDSIYYQQFSYVLRSRINRNSWIDHVLGYLHPTGTVLYNDRLIDTDPGFSTGSLTSAMAVTNQVETQVGIPTIQPYLATTNFTFDRIADNFTGTSTTRLATTTGFAIITYLTSNAVGFAYDAVYDYPGENITWALQKVGDTGTITEVIRFDGASFDKFSAGLSYDQQIICWPADVNSSLVVTRYITGTSNLVANTVLTSLTTTSLTYSNILTTTTSVGSMILIINWNKNSQGNNAQGESANAVVISFSSASVIIPYFDDETQRNLRRIAVSSTLSYRQLIYYHSSNSITANISSNVALSSNTVGRIVFKPYNWERGATYDRCAIRFELGQPQQLNTSLTETFASANITASGIIASWSSSSYATSASIQSFTGTSNAVLLFPGNSFVFNGDTAQTRIITTTSFTTASLINVNTSYIVGDNFNGGTLPTINQDLVLQYSVNSGTTWVTSAVLWAGSSSINWSYGTTSLAGQIITQAGTNYITGVNTTFATDLSIGDRITIVNSSVTTAYTITSIINNNLLQVAPNTVTFNAGFTSLGTISTGAGSGTISSNGGFVNLQIGTTIAVTSSNGTTTYTVTQLVDSSTITVAPNPVYTTSVTGYLATGIAGYKKLPASLGFYTTSISAYAGAATSVILRIVQTSQLGPNTVNYAIDNLQVNSYRTQATTGTVNMSVAVSSNSALKIADNDYFTVTTIGI